MGFMEHASAVVLDADKRFRNMESRIDNLDTQYPIEDRDYFKQRLLTRYRIETGKLFIQYIPTEDYINVNGRMTAPF